MKPVYIEDLDQETINMLIDKEERFYVITKGSDESSVLSGHILHREADEFWSNRDRLPRPLYATHLGEENPRGGHVVSLKELMGRIRPDEQRDEAIDVSTREWELYRREVAASYGELLR